MLISKTTISNDPVERHEYTLTIKVPVTFYEGDLDPRTSETLQDVLRSWSDGRYPFYVEMFKEGLYKCLKDALVYCIREDCQKEFGREMVQTGKGNQTARWALEAEKRKPNMPYIGEDVKVEIC